MRKIISAQVQMGEIDISQIEIDLHCRDEIPQLLLGMQHIYCTDHLRKKLFELLFKIVPDNIDIHNGRPGMHLWRIFVLGALRLCCRWDYDKLQEIANNHITLRQMLGHGFLDNDRCYSRQSLHDNLSWFTEGILGEINQIIVEAGYDLLGASGDKEPTHGRCDSFVVETNVHFPTDLNLLWDAIRKTITLTAQFCENHAISGWRQAGHNLKKIKKLYRRAQKERDRDKESFSNYQATKSYTAACDNLFEKAYAIASSCEADALSAGLIEQILQFIEDGRRQIDQIDRRCNKGETIPHSQKIFSLFKRHTEWISKGKAGINQELGLRVCILESKEGFILHHRVMQKETDDKVAVPMIKEAKTLYQSLKSCSFDKGFHSPQNQKELASLLSFVVLPKKGKCTKQEQEHESSDSFRDLRRKHSAVESAINALEHNGLSVCRDYGIDGFKRYVALSVVSRNIQIIGRILQVKAIEAAQKKKERPKIA